MFLQELFDRRNGFGEYSEFAQATHDDSTGLNSPRSAPLNEDASLVERLRNGDDEAFEEMVRKYGGRLLASARRYLRSDDACDALQDAFLRAFKSINTFKGDAQLSTWLHRILVNCALMHLRLKRRHPVTDGIKIDELLPRFDPAGNWIDERMITMPVHAFLKYPRPKQWSGDVSISCPTLTESF
jgi:RNA polymerase sigma factor (sigma-70 family)